MDFDREFAALKALSARVGSNPLLVQGAGGNTSIKHQGVMWIKASGTWLAHAATRDIMVPVDIGELRRRLPENDPRCENCLAFVRQDLNGLGLRPSIETSVHGVLPQKVVVHVHCVETIAWAVQKNAPALLQDRLRGFDWAFIPYRKPGLSLSIAIRERLKPETDVLILGNHGLVVAAETVAAAGDLLESVVTALRREVRPAREPDLQALSQLAAGSGYRLPQERVAHLTALDRTSLAFAKSGSLYPDHVVFLGPGVTVVEAGNLAAVPEERPPLLLLSGRGALTAENAGLSVEPMARCLADVTARLSPDDDVQVLTAEDEAALLDWDAEKYRQSLAARA